jgi:hypothetical protein
MFVELSRLRSPLAICWLITLLEKRDTTLSAPSSCWLPSRRAQSLTWRSVCLCADCWCARLRSTLVAGSSLCFFRETSTEVGIKALHTHFLPASALMPINTMQYYNIMRCYLREFISGARTHCRRWSLSIGCVHSPTSTSTNRAYACNNQFAFPSYSEMRNGGVYGLRLKQASELDVNFHLTDSRSFPCN